jgi:hypothetical protein
VCLLSLGDLRINKRQRDRGASDTQQLMWKDQGPLRLQIE